MKIIASIFILCCSLGVCYAESLKNDLSFTQDTGFWCTQSYWSGTLERENGMLKLIPKRKGNKNWIKLFCSRCRQMDYYPEQIFRITLESKGNGQFTTGLIFYGKQKNEIKYLNSKTVILSPEIKKYVFEITLHEIPVRILPYMYFEGAAPAYIKSYKLENIVSHGSFIKTAAKHQIVSDTGTPPHISFETNQSNTEVGFYQKNHKRILLGSQHGKTDASGKIQFQMSHMPQGEYKLTGIVHGGASASVFTDVMSNSDFTKMDSLAKKIQVSKPVHILFLGDSLSDFYRGRNYIDKVEFWLNKHNPGKFTIRNAGVGGDYLPRVEERLLGIHGKKHAYRQNMYKNLFDEKYDLIFIFLGQNDTYVTNTGNYDNPKTPADQHKEILMRVIKFLRKHSNAKIVLISPSPSDEQLSFALYKKMNRPKIGKFGSPKHVNAFDATNREVCREQKLEYIDILNPMRKIPDRKSLYVEDGVHLSTIGARVISKEIITWFASGTRF